MNDRHLKKLGLDSVQAQNAARICIKHAEAGGMSGTQIRKCLHRVAKAPQRHLNDPFFAPLAEALTGRQAQTVVTGVRKTGKSGARFQQWGTDLDPQAVLQMEQACSLPVAVRGALMPDAHVGYGLPIGGVLATQHVDLARDGAGRCGNPFSFLLDAPLPFAQFLILVLRREKIRPCARRSHAEQHDRQPGTQRAGRLASAPQRSTAAVTPNYCMGVQTH
mgnify:CR=1 FL=1